MAVKHAVDSIDLTALPLEEVMNYAARKCSCIRIQMAAGITEPECTNTCSHALALQEMANRGIIT